MEVRDWIQGLVETNKIILEETIYTAAGSDVYYFSGAKRSRRARAVNISKSVLEFIEVLLKSSREKLPGVIANYRHRLGLTS